MTIPRPSVLATAILLTALLLAGMPQRAWSAQAGVPAGAVQVVPSATCPGLSVVIGYDPDFTMGQQLCSAAFMACANGYSTGSYTISLCPWGSGTCVCYWQSLTTLPDLVQCNAEYEACLARLNPDPINPEPAAVPGS